MAILFSFRFNRHRNKGILSSCLWSINKYNILESESPKMFLSKSLSISITLWVCMLVEMSDHVFTLIFSFSMSLYPSVNQFYFSTARQYSKWSDFGVAWTIGINPQKTLFFLIQQVKTIMKLQLHAKLSNFLSS